MRVKHSFLVFAALALLAPTFLFSQPGSRGPGGSGGPGGFGGSRGPGGGMPSFDPNAFFDRLSGGKDVIVRSELKDEMSQRMFDRWASQLNDNSGQITRAQYQQVSQQFMSMRPGGGPSSGGPSFGSPMGGSPSTGSPMGGAPTMRFGPGGGPGSSERDRGGDRGDRRGPGGPMMITGPGGSGGPNPVDQQSEFFFQRMDRNKDGMLSFEEMSERLQGERDKWDTNKDGFVDLNEYKGYMVAREAERQGGNNAAPNGTTNSPAPTQNNTQPDPVILPQVPQQPEEPDRRPVVIRAGKLPKDIPGWWKEADTDEDGQLGLYEWRRYGKSLDEFASHDTNEDGLLTAEEYLKSVKLAKEGSGKGTGTASLASLDPNGGTGFGPGGGRQFGSNGSSSGGRQTFGDRTQSSNSGGDNRGRGMMFGPGGTGGAPQFGFNRGRGGESKDSGNGGATRGFRPKQ